MPTIVAIQLNGNENKLHNYTFTTQTQHVARQLSSGVTTL